MRSASAARRPTALRGQPLAPMPRDPAQALAPYDPRAGHGPWDARLAAHLLRRALGGGTPRQARALARGGAAEAVASVFGASEPAREAAWERLGRAAALAGEDEGLAAWLLLALAQESRATGARLALFWHGHFACARSKVRENEFLRHQQQTLLDAGAGPFEQLALSIAREPAMLRFLDGDGNRRGTPNENLGREILELFVLGEGNYTEDDVKEGARCLTGRTVRRGRYMFVPEHHDPRPKAVLGRMIGDGDDFVRLAVAQPACPRFLIGKLWRFYVSPEPPQDVVDLLAERWREHGLETAWLLRSLLGSRAFFSAQAWRSLVKSPADYAVGVVRALAARPDFRRLARTCAAMGQALFEPPGVQGWAGGESWIHASAWIERTNFAAAVARGETALLGAADLQAAVPRSARGTAEDALDALAALFLDGELAPARRAAVLAALGPLAAGESDVRLGALAHAVLSLPEHHLA